MQKDEILERLLFSEAVVATYDKAKRTRTEPAADHWSRPVLLERAAYLRKLARFSEGAASETIRDFPGSNIMLTVLLRSGDAIVHEKCAEILIALDGSASLVTGGVLKQAERIGSEEIRGTAISSGETREVRTGDVVHLPAGIPYQLLLAGDKTFSCLVVRMEATPEAHGRVLWQTGQPVS